MKLGQWIGLISLAAALYILWQIRQILLLIFMAIVIAIALNKLARLLQRLNLPRQVAIPMVLGGTMFFGTLFVVGIVPPFVEQFTLLLELLVSGIGQLPIAWERLQDQLPIELPSFPDITYWITDVESTSAFGIFRNFFSVFNNTLQVVLQGLLVVALSLMLLVNPQAYRQGTLKLFPAFYRQRADDILCACERALCNWLGGISINSLFIFAFSFVGLSLLGVRLVLAHALIAGMLNVIPNIGPTLSVIFPVTVALLSPTPWKAIAVLTLYIVIQNIESYWLTPTVMERKVSLLPAITLMAQIVFFTMFGFLGLVLALPLAVVAKVWIQELLIKDVLDQWHPPLRQRMNAVIPAPVARLAQEQGPMEDDETNAEPQKWR
ncbi:MAG: AI-2E family transporter [Cyanobacteria bacterium P01_A01_bin.123]